MSIRRSLLSLAVGIFFVVILLKRVSPGDIFNTIAAVDIRFAGAAFASYMIANAFRVERFYLLLERKIARRELFPIIFIYNFLNAVSPVFGVVSHLHLIQRTGGVSVGQNTSSFVASRIVDAIIVGLFFLVLLVGALGTNDRTLLMFAVGGTLGIAGIFFLLVVWGKRGVDSFKAWLRRMFGERPLFISFFRHGDDIAEGFLLLRQRRTLVSLFFTSFFVWLSIFASGYLLLRSVGLSIGTADGMFSFVFPIFVSLLPITSPGSIGTYEASLAAGLFLVGIPKTIAISASFAVHVQELLFVIIIGGAGFLYHAFQKKNVS